MTNKNNISSKSKDPTPYALRPTPPLSAMPAGRQEAKWYAFYTAPRAEKKVAARFEEENIEYFLPLIKTMKVWSDRRKMVEIPLINSYIFVKVQEHLLRDVLNVHGVSRYISFEGKPAAIPEYQINNLRLLVNSEEEFEISGENLRPGDAVEVTHGTLGGLRGELIKIGNKNKVVVRIDRLDLNLVVTIQKAFLKKLR